MGKQEDQLAVRRHDRQDCDLPGWVRVDDVHSAQVVFSRAVVENGGVISVRIVDCSRGGLGVRSSVYLPRGVKITVGFCTESGQHETEHELQVRVQRGSMVERTPTYYLGTSVVEHPGAKQTLASLLAFAAQVQGPTGEAA